MGAVRQGPHRPQPPIPRSSCQWEGTGIGWLAIPHYLVLAVLLGGGGWFAWKGGWDRGGDDWRWGGGPGLIVLLGLFAAIALLFTTRYPRGIFDFVMGVGFTTSIAVEIGRIHAPDRIYAPYGPALREKSAVDCVLVA